MTHQAPKVRVLAIDDDEIAREALVGTLEAGGFEVYGSGSAIGASRMIARQNIDAVVLDVMMPELNGDKLARLMRQNPRGTELAIVLVSSRSMLELQELARASGADAVVPKQAIYTDLVDAVRTACQKRLRRAGT